MHLPRINILFKWRAKEGKYFNGSYLYVNIYEWYSIHESETQVDYVCSSNHLIPLMVS